MIAAVALIMLGVLLGISGLSSLSPDGGLLQECPDRWYIDRMPMVHSPGDKPQRTREYFVVAGRGRVDYEAMDVEWVKSNCKIRPSVVY